MTQQHPMKDADVHNIRSITDLRIVSSVSTTDSEQPPLVLLDTDTLEYVEQQQTEQAKASRRNNNTTVDAGDDPNPSTKANENTNSNNHGMVLYLLLPIESRNEDDENTAMEEWETIQVVSTDV